jgi:hypothetical protein
MSASELARQTRRRANLRHLIQLLESEGIESPSVQAGILANLTALQLQGLLEGGAIPDALAREIEWAMHRPDGWMDRRPEGGLDD